MQFQFSSSDCQDEQIQQVHSQEEMIDYNISQFLDLNHNSCQEDSRIVLQLSSKSESTASYGHDQSQHFQQENVAKKQEVSIFHNFQKHLITLLKKQISFGSRNLEKVENKATIIALWRAFKKYKSSNKKILHILFGIKSTINLEQELNALAIKNRQFDRLKCQHTLEQIKEAQEFIKDEVIHQSQKIDRKYMEEHCSMSRMEHFLEYFNNFMVQLKGGVVMKRLSKKQKNAFIRRIQERQTTD